MAKQKSNKFPEEAISDRGQISKAELDTLLTYWRWKDQQEYIKNYGLTDGLQLVDYSPGDSKYEDCAPLGFGWRTMTVGIKTDDVIGVINSLSTGLVEKTKWVENCQPGRHLSKYRGNLALVTPPCGGTVFIELWYKNTISVAHYQHVIDALGPEYANISAHYGDVYSVWTYRSSADVGFVKWEKGIVVRAVSSGIDDHRSFGNLVDGEKGLRTVYGGGEAYWCADMDEMMDYLGINSNRITPLRPDETAYCWIIGVP